MIDEGPTRGSAPSSALMEVLERAPLFARLDPGSLEMVAMLAHRRCFRRGTMLFHEGDPGDTLYVLIEGAAKVYVTSRKGDEMVLATLRAPHTLGEVSLFDQGARSASVEALEPITAAAFARSALLALIVDRPAIGAEMLRAAGGLLRRITSQAAELVFLDLEGRVAKVLVAMAECQGEPRDGSLVLDLGVTQADLARMVGGSRQSVNQILHSLQGRGLLKLEGRRVAILRLEELRRLAGLDER